MPGMKLLAAVLVIPALLGCSKSGAKGPFAAHVGPVLCVAYSYDGAMIATGGQDKTVRIWDAQTGKLVETLAGHSGPVTALAFTPDRITLASGSWEDGSVRFWKLRDWSLIRTTAVPGGARALAYTGDSNRLVVGGGSQVAVLLDVVRGTKIADLDTHQAGGVPCVAASADGLVVATGSGLNTSDARVKIWAAIGGQEGASVQMNDGMVLGVAFNSAGSVLVTGSVNQSIMAWDTATLKPVGAMGKFCDATGSLSLAFSTDGKFLASGHPDRTVRIWNTENWIQASVLRGHAGPVNGIAWSLDGARLVSVSQDGGILRWEAATGRRLAP